MTEETIRHAHRLEEIGTRAPKELEKQPTKLRTTQLADRLSELQHLLYAEGKHSLLIVLQGMDASGKDGSIRALMTGINPLGARVVPFKKPTEEEFAHDFLWRVHEVVPRKGMVAVFNRSHYEDVLIQRIHEWIDMDHVRQRFAHINAFERLLTEENGTTILKFYLHVSREEQLERLQERMTVRRKMWKYNAKDFAERERWDDYMQAYEDVFEHCGPEQPWIIVPSDQNWYKEFLVTKTVVDTLEGFGMQYPRMEV